MVIEQADCNSYHIVLDSITNIQHIRWCYVIVLISLIGLTINVKHLDSLF